jgi:hypothetical protein
MVSKSSPRLEKLGEGNDAKLTRGFRGGAVTEGGRQRRSKSAAASSRGHEAWNREKRWGMRQRVVGKEGVVCGAFYRVAGEARGRRRPAAVHFYLTVSTLNWGGESMRRCASAGEGRRPGGCSIQLRPSARGRWTAARGAVATGRTGGGSSGGMWKMALGDGPNWPVRPNGTAWQLGWLSVFGPKIRIWIDGLQIWFLNWFQGFWVQIK